MRNLNIATIQNKIIFLQKLWRNQTGTTINTFVNSLINK